MVYAVETTLGAKDNVSQVLERLIKVIGRTDKEFKGLQTSTDRTFKAMAASINRLDGTLAKTQKEMGILGKKTVEMGQAMGLSARASAHMGQAFLALGRGAQAAGTAIGQTNLQTIRGTVAAERAETVYQRLARSIRQVASASEQANAHQFRGGGSGGSHRGGGHGGGFGGAMGGFASGFAGGMGLPFGGVGATLGGVAHAMGEEVFKSNNEFASQMTKMKMSGLFDQKQTEEAYKLANEMTKKFPTSSINENMKTIREMSGITNSAEEGMHMAPMVRKVQVVLSAAEESHPGLKGHKDDVEKIILKMAEKTGNLLGADGKPDDAKFMHFANMIVKSNIAEQGLASPKLLDHIITFMRSSRTGLDDKMYPVIGAMAADMGNNAGPMLGSLQKLMNSQNKAAHGAMIRLGLGDARGNPSDAMFQSNPFEWATTKFKPAMLQKEGRTDAEWQKMSKSEQKAMTIRNLPGFNSIAMDTMIQFLTDEARLRKAIAGAERVKDVNEQVNDAQTNMTASLKAVGSAWEDMNLKIGRSSGLMDPVSNILMNLARGMRNIGDGVENFSKNMPETAHLLSAVTKGLLGTNGALEQTAAMLSEMGKAVAPYVEGAAKLGLGAAKGAKDLWYQKQVTEPVNDGMGGVTNALNNVLQARGIKGRIKSPAQLAAEQASVKSSTGAAISDYLGGTVPPPPAVQSKTASALLNYISGAPGAVTPGGGKLVAPPLAVPTGLTGLPSDVDPKFIKAPLPMKGRGKNMVVPPPPALPDMVALAKMYPQYMQQGGAIPSSSAPPPPINVTQTFHGPADPHKVRKASHDGIAEGLAKHAALHAVTSQGGNFGAHSTADTP